MTQLVLDLPVDLYDRLHAFAVKRGIPSAEAARDLLAEQLPPPALLDERTQVIRVLQEAKLLTELSADEKKRAAQCDITLEEVSDALDPAGGPPLSELIVETMVSQAVALTQNHRLRGYDAIQLATALELNATLNAAGLRTLVFITADIDLSAAAQAEGLVADRPNNHP
jgi:hypothetical protein